MRVAEQIPRLIDGAEGPGGVLDNAVIGGGYHVRCFLLAERERIGRDALDLPPAAGLLQSAGGAVMPLTGAAA